MVKNKSKLVRYLVKTSVDVQHTKDTCKSVSARFKSLGLTVTFDVEDIVLDTTQELLYDTENSWSFLKLERTKSIKWAIVYAFHKPTYDGTVLVVDKKKGLQSSTLRGQHTSVNGIGLIELYSEKANIRKRTLKGKTYYDTTKRKSDITHDAHVLFHEIVHDLDARIGNTPTALHDAELADQQEDHVKTIIAKLDSKKKVYPLDEWLTKVSQPYGAKNKVLYPSTGVHWGVDHAVPVGTPIFAPCDGFLREDDTGVKDLGTHALYSFKDGKKYYTLVFAHLSKKARYGEYKKGDIIGYSGNTGKSTAPHLHTEQWKGLVLNRGKITTQTIDPMSYF